MTRKIELTKIISTSIPDLRMERVADREKRFAYPASETATIAGANAAAGTPLNIIDLIKRG
jgi:tryptophan synthase alpha subunit